MRMIGLLFTAVIAVGIYYFYLKQAAPAPGMVATQAISTTGVEMDLNAIAQSERMYFAQNGSYADLGQLTSSGALTMARSLCTIPPFQSTKPCNCTRSNSLSVLPSVSPPKHLVRVC